MLWTISERNVTKILENILSAYGQCKAISLRIDAAEGEVRKYGKAVCRRYHITSTNGRMSVR